MTALGPCASSRFDVGDVIKAGLRLLDELAEARPLLAKLGRMVSGLELRAIGPLDIDTTWLPSSLRCRQTEMKPGWVAMKRARSAIRSSTSDWLFGGTLTVVIWVTMSVFSRISGMCVLPIVHRDNAEDGAKFRLARLARPPVCAARSPVRSRPCGAPCRHASARPCGRRAAPRPCARSPADRMPR